MAYVRLLSYSQDPTIGPYCETDESGPKLPSTFFMINFDSTFPYRLRYSKWFLSFKASHQNLSFFYPRFYKYPMFRQSHPFNLIILILLVRNTNLEALHYATIFGLLSPPFLYIQMCSSAKCYWKSFISTVPISLETQFHTHITAVKATNSNRHFSLWINENLILFDFCAGRGLIS
jgi:hypothetical protein